MDRTPGTASSLTATRRSPAALPVEALDQLRVLAEVADAEEALAHRLARLAAKPACSARRAAFSPDRRPRQGPRSPRTLTGPLRPSGCLVPTQPHSPAGSPRSPLQAP